MINKKGKSETVTVIILLIWVILVIGYIGNIVRLCHCDFASPYKAEVVYTLGILLPPVAWVVGYTGIADGEQLKVLK